MKVLITGGAGFIGANSARFFLERKDDVIIVDNLSRPNVDLNLEWLKNFGNYKFYKADVRNYDDLKSVFEKEGPFDLILHLAAQVAVTTSVVDPREDMEINVIGTFNVLEATRHFSKNSTFIYSSTNKVYGGLEDIIVIEEEKRYRYANQGPVSELRPLDFHSPYGCSKGAADQYVRDYSRIYGLKTVVMRQSCIYGTRQFGLEDQGWVAWFIIAAMTDKKIHIYGDGKQVRDVLYISDLVNAYYLAHQNIEKISGRVFNIGGGPLNTLSLLELIEMLEKILGKKIEFDFNDWRPGDQRVFISDISAFQEATGWNPNVSPEEGVKKTIEYVKENLEFFKG